MKCIRKKRKWAKIWERTCSKLPIKYKQAITIYKYKIRNYHSNCKP